MLISSHPILSRFLVWVVSPIVLVLGLAYGFLLQSLPQKGGILSFEGLVSPVTIIRDEHGVPHIFADTDHDAFFALGYVHAQDRMWQMSFKTRMAKGRLSEVLGRGSVNTDKLMRTLGLSRAAQTALESLDEFAQQSLVAYANGVNAWIKEGNTPPIEFYILDTEPELWQPTDSLLLIKLMALNLQSVNFENELTLDLLINELGLAKANEVMPDVNSEALSVTEAAGLADKKIVQGLMTQTSQLLPPYHAGREGLGSNAWAVSGKFTESGLPILASDPHLPVEMPSVWYLAEIQGGRLHVTGATHPGVPAVIMGHNESIAWGNTNMLADAQDIYVERTNPLNEDQYEVDRQWLDMEVEEELIYIKSDFPRFLTDPIPPLRWEARRTRHGPLISDAIGRVDRPLALRWTALDEQDKTFQSFLEVNYAMDWESFKSALEGYAAPALNFIYADTQGDIGLFAAGKIPIRRHGNGRLPVPGWQSIYDWDSYIPLDSLPQFLNPDEGYVANANNRNHSEGYPYIVANIWAAPYRFERIRQTIERHLEAERKMAVRDFVDLQGNTHSVQAEDLLRFLKGLTPRTPRQEDALDQLKEWTGNISKESNEAVMYEVWFRHFNALLIADDLRGNAVHEARGDELQGFVATLKPTFVNRVVNLSSTLQFNWCDQVNTAAEETCEELALIALDAAIDEVDRLLGADKKWGDIHQTYFPHPVFTNTQLLDLVFDRAIASGGDRYTVNIGNWNYSEERGYETTINSNYRQVIDLSDWNRGGFINNTGQSGNFLSKHYTDNISPFKELKLWPMHLDAGQGSGNVSTLMLEPIKQ